MVHFKMNTRLKSLFRWPLFFISILFPLVGHTSGCHGGGGSQTLVLLPTQYYQFGISTSYQFMKGSFDSYGFYNPTPSHSSLSSMTMALGAGMRFLEFWQGAFSLPMIHRNQTTPQKNYSATALGDPVLEIRHTFLEDVGFLPYQPELNFYGGVKLPLGTSVYTSSDPSEIDVVGDGMTTVHTGFNTAKLYRPFKFSLDGSFFYPFQKKVTQIRNVSLETPYVLKSVNLMQLIENISFLLNNHWNSALGIKELWILKSKKDKTIVEGSAGRLFSTTASLSYAYDVSWNVGMSYETAFPFYRYAVNQPHSHSFSVALNYGIF